MTDTDTGRLLIWLRRRFGQRWPLHLLWNCGGSLALLLLTLTTGPWWLAIFAAILVGFTGHNAMYLYCIRLDGERLGLDLEARHD